MSDTAKLTALALCFAGALGCAGSQRDATQANEASVNREDAMPAPADRSRSAPLELDRPPPPIDRAQPATVATATFALG